MFEEEFERSCSVLESVSSAVVKMAPMTTPSKATHNENIQVENQSIPRAVELTILTFLEILYWEKY